MKAPATDAGKVNEPVPAEPSGAHGAPELKVPADPSGSHEQPSAPRRAGRLWRAGVPIVLAVLVGMAFMPALSAGFVHWDDDDLLFRYTPYQQLDADSLRWIFTTSYTGHFQPLAWLSYSLDFALWKYEPFGYHLTNVVLHLLTAFVFYLVARRLLAAGIGRLEAARSMPVVLASSFAALLFAIHPLRAESVAWIAERRDVLSGFFYLLAVLFYLYYASGRTGSGFLLSSRRSGRMPFLALLASVLFCGVSLLAKASAVMLPVVLLILDVYPLRRLRIRRTGIFADHPRIWLEKVPFLILGLAVGIRAISAQSEGGALHSLAQHGLFARLAQACYGLVFYLQKTVWPADLGPLYELPGADVLTGSMFWMSLAALAVIVTVVVAAGRRVPAVPVAFAVYVVQAAPVLGLFQSGPQLVADRYSYLSCMGFAVLAGAALLWWLNRPVVRGSESVRGLTAVACAALITLLSHATFDQARVWHSPLSLWTRGVQVCPQSSIAHVNLADALATAGLKEEAVVHYRIGLGLNPADDIAASHLGRILEQIGERRGAARMYQRAIRLNPDRTDDYLRLAELLVQRDNAVEAVGVLRRRAVQAPGDLEIVAYLADILATHPDAEIRDGPEAVKWATHLARADGEADGVDRLHLASALAEVGRYAEAVEAAEAALRLPEVRSNEPLARELRRRVDLFRRQKPYRFGH